MNQLLPGVVSVDILGVFFLHQIAYPSPSALLVTLQKTPANAAQESRSLLAALSTYLTCQQQTNTIKPTTLSVLLVPMCRHPKRVASNHQMRSRMAASTESTGTVQILWMSRKSLHLLLWTLRVPVVWSMTGSSNAEWA